MDCPRHQLPLAMKSVAGHIGYQCPHCEGVWLPASLCKALETRFRHFCWRSLQAKLRHAPQRTTTLSCPADGSALTAALYRSTLVLDCCPLCDGIWFDHHTLGQFLSSFQPIKDARPPSGSRAALTSRDPELAEGLLEVFTEFGGDLLRFLAHLLHRSH